MRTTELIGPALDWAVAKCEGEEKSWGESSLRPYEYYMGHRYSTNWSMGGPIIERENIGIGAEGEATKVVWAAQLSFSKEVKYADGIARRFCTMRGPTPLIAAMRCYCCATLGDEIEIPQELQPCQQPNP